MKKWIRRAGLTLGIVLVVLAIGLGGAYAASASKEARRYDVEDAALEIPSDAESIAEGERLYASRGCAECHGEDGAGHVLADDPAIGTIVGTNLTTLDASPADWSRAVRHGVRRDARSLVFMPSGDYALMSDEELARIVAYARSLPRIDHGYPTLQIGVVARVVDLAGGFVLFPAAEIDHAAAVVAPTPGRTVAYGQSLSRLCAGCHGERFSGGAIPGAPPETGMPPNLTPDATGLAGWTEDDFRRVLREGRTPTGHEVALEQMPWRSFGRMTDDEIGALWIYFQSLPPTPEGNR